MAYKQYNPQYDWSWLDKQQAQPKTTTGKTSVARQAYIKTLGFTPKDMPEFRSERPKPKGIMKVFDVLDRARSGVAAGMNQMYTEDIAKSKKTGRSMGSVNAERAFKNIGPLGLSNIKYLPTMIEGAKGDTNFTGKSLVSRYYDDPHVRKQITPSQAKMVDNKVYRGGVGFATDIMTDPTNLIPLGAITKPVKYVSKATGLTNKVINPASKAIKGSHAVKGIVKTLGGGRDAKHLANIHKADTVAAVGAEIANFTKKATEGVISKGDKVKLVANVTGTVGMLTDEKNAVRVADKVSKAFDKSQAGMAKLKAMGVELDQKRLYEEMVGAGPVTEKMMKNEVDSIVNEARKYKSAEEFVRARARMYRAGSKFDPARGANTGISMTPSKKIAQNKFSGFWKKGPVNRLSLAPDTRIMPFDEIPKNLYKFEPNGQILPIDSNGVGYRGKNGDYEEIIELAKQRGYDAVDLKRFGEGEIRVINPKKVITEEQLADIWKKANTGGGVTRKGITAVDKIYKDIASLGRTLQDDVVTDLIARTGKVSKEVLEKNRGEYLRGLYQAQDPGEYIKQIAQPRQGSHAFGAEVGLTKMRKNNALRAIEFMRQNPNPEFEPILKEFGSGKNLSVKKLNDAAEALQPKIQAVLGDDFNKFALEGRRAAGLVDEANLALPESIEQGIRFASTDTMLKKTAEFAMDFPSESVAKAADFKLIPNTAKYGDLAGKYVPDVVFDDIVGLIEPGGGMMRQALNNWKKLKLFSPLNFAPNARNMISDMTANSLVEGGPSVIKQIALMPKAIDDYWKGGKYTKLLTEKGVFASKYASQEGRRQLASAMGKQADGGVMDLVTKATDKFTSKSLNTRIPGVGFGTEAYGYTSDIGKMVQIIHQVEKNGLSIDDAIKMADKATFDYAKLPVSLRKYRDNLMPFMTYKYFATQLVWDTFLNRTGKITKLTHARRAVEGLSEDKANDRDLPQYMKDNRPFYFRLPGQFDDQQNNPRYLDMSYLLPMGDVGGTSPKDLVFGNPFVKTAVEFATNKSMFNDMPIVQDTDMPTEKAKKYALYLATQFGPSAPWMPNNQGDIKLLDAARGKENTQGNKMSLTYEAPARLAGIRTQEVNPKLQRKYNGYDKKDRITELNSKIKKVKKSDDDLETKKKKIARLKQQIKDIKNN